MTERWYVLRSKPSRETELCCCARSRGHEVYYPTLPADATTPQAHPYFPGMLFVRADLTRVSSLDFRWLPYSRGLISVGGRPAWVEERVVRAIQAKVASIWDKEGAAFERADGIEDVFEHEEWIQAYSVILDAGASGFERVCVLLAMLTDGHESFERAESPLQRPVRRIPTPEA
ncbi:MAG: transcription termination/antitermination NusG family protein [Anaerolineales bacterium]